ncbi:MAG: anti-sigma-K factor RskA [Paracoccaceae bacterium]|jgi:anti-sigma-K factor RskA
MTEDAHTPSVTPEDDLLAAELALGGLDYEGRIRLQARAEHDPAFAARVAAWEATLAPMAADYPAIAPPPATRHRLMRDLFGSVSPAANARRAAYDPGAAASAAHASGFARKLAAWQALAVGGVAAACLMFVAPMLTPPGDGMVGPKHYVAVLSSDTGDLSFVAVLDPADGDLLVRRVVGQDAGDGSYQLWMVGADGPVSLGLLDEGAPKPHAAMALPEGAVLAVSREPLGGSTTGAPSRVVATGAPKGL